MRYFDITLSKTSGGAPIMVPSPAFGQSGYPAHWTSHPNGKFDPGAQLVEFDMTILPHGAPQTGAWVRVWGVDLGTMQNAAMFGATSQGSQGAYITLFGGMKKGLPLANPAQAGLLLSGQVLQSYGNWRGTDQTLDLQVIAAPSTPSRPVNLQFSWPKGSTLAAALKSCLALAFPGLKQAIEVSAALVAPADEIGIYGTTDTLAQYINSVSKSVIGRLIPSYPGVSIVAQGGTIRAFDGTKVQTPKQIEFVDLIGQPTWLQLQTISVQTVLRADIRAGDTIKLPPQLSQLGSYTLNTPQSQASYRNASAIQGAFLVYGVRHLGNSRSPDGAAWSSTFQCSPVASVPTATTPPTGTT